MIGLISLDMKQMGARSAGNPHAACDVEGAGDVARSKYLGRAGAPVLDPTCGNRGRATASGDPVGVETDRSRGTAPVLDSTRASHPVRRVSAAVINVETAVVSWAGENGFEITTLSGTPFDENSWLLSAVM
jgi:hypothetical protein